VVLESQNEAWQRYSTTSTGVEVSDDVVESASVVQNCLIHEATRYNFDVFVGRFWVL
jgi:hypothetical protein